MKNRAESLAAPSGGSTNLSAFRRSLAAVLLAAPACVLACMPAIHSEPTASLSDFYETDALVVLVTGHPASPQETAKGITRLKVIKWLKGTGPDELDATGFPLLDERSPMFNACRLGTLYPGKQYVVVLESPLRGDSARVYGQQRAAGKLVVQTSWASP